MSVYKKFMVAAMTIVTFAAVLAWAIPRVARNAGSDAAEGFVQGVRDGASDAVRSVGEVIDSVITEEMVDTVDSRLQGIAGSLGRAVRTLCDSALVLPPKPIRQ